MHVQLLNLSREQPRDAQLRDREFLFCDRIQFTIVSADFSTNSALVTITHRPCRCFRVPQEVGGTVTVYDTMEFFVDETEEALVGRKGTAWLGMSAASAQCVWLIDGLQCEPGDYN